MRHSGRVTQQKGSPGEQDQCRTSVARKGGVLAIPFEAHATIGDLHYLVAGDGNQISVVEAWASTPAGLADPPRRTDGSWTQTACGNTNGIVNSWIESVRP